MADRELTADEQRVIQEGRRASQDLAKKVGQPGDHVVSMAKHVEGLPSGTETVVVNVPKTFVLTLDAKDGHKQLRVPAGPCEIPSNLADHWYVKANGVAPMPGRRMVREEPKETEAERLAREEAERKAAEEADRQKAGESDSRKKK